MSRFAVAYVTFFGNELRLEIVEASSWFEAIIKHSFFNRTDKKDLILWIRAMDGSTLEEVQEEFFNCDSLISVIAITIN